MCERVTIYTDGGCRGNPGLGGWGVVLMFKDTEKELYGGEKNTTNNRMEMTAAIKALTALTKPCKVDLYTDSQYLKKGITEWIENWKRRGWKTSSRAPVKNADLWRILDKAIAQHDINWFWVKGHGGNPGNEKADALANKAMDEM